MAAQPQLFLPPPPIRSIPSNGDFFNFPPGPLQSPANSPGGLYILSPASVGSSSELYNFPPGSLGSVHGSTTSVASMPGSTTGFYNFPPGPLAFRSPSEMSVAGMSSGGLSAASPTARYNFPPGGVYSFRQDASPSARSPSARGAQRLVGSFRASKASMVSIAENGSGGADEPLDDLLAEGDFSPHAVECVATPGASPVALTAQRLMPSAAV